MPADLTGLFDDSNDLESRLEAASYLLKEAADEEGVDLSQFSDSDVADMLYNTMQGADNDNGGEGEGDDEGDGKTAGYQVTVSDVAMELTKRAAYNDFDLASLDRDEYQELFDKVASEMTDPEVAYESQKIAAQEEHMDHLGRVAARGFVDEINKIAADEDDEKDDDERRDEKLKKAALEILGKYASGGVGEHLGKAYRAAKANVNKGFEGVGNRAIDAAAGSKGQHQYSSTARRQSLGKKITGTGAGATALTGGGAYAATRGKKDKDDRKPSRGRR